MRGIDSCQPSHIDALRQATFGATPVKELSIVDPDGRTLCNDVGNRTDARAILSSEPLIAGSRTLLEVLQLGEQSEELDQDPATGRGLRKWRGGARFPPNCSCRKSRFAAARSASTFA